MAHPKLDLDMDNAEWCYKTNTEEKNPHRSVIAVGTNLWTSDSIWMWLDDKRAVVGEETIDELITALQYWKLKRNELKGR